jgi:hypothetical protein
MPFQVNLVYAICTIHNLINRFQLQPDAIQQAAEHDVHVHLGYNLSPDVPTLEPNDMISLRDQMAQEMWDDYLSVLAHRAATAARD